ncbi:MAG: signal peptidase I [Actinomycetota bacterium]|nr:signal peptidase I [Actinomycetota bacterium]
MADRPSTTPARALLIGGGLLLVASLLLGFLAAVPAVVLGILAIRRGHRLAGGVIVGVGALIAVAGAGLAVLFTGMEARTFRIPNESNLPTLAVGDRVLTVPDDAPDRGDIVVFHPPAGAIEGRCGAPRRSGQPCPRPTGAPAREYFIKRVAALPGERVTVIGGIVHVDGRPLEEPYARADRACYRCNLRRAIVVPPGHLFVMGDHRAATNDSRTWGPLPRASLVGRVILRYWPPSRLGGL